MISMLNILIFIKIRIGN